MSADAETPPVLTGRIVQAIIAPSTPNTMSVTIPATTVRLLRFIFTSLPRYISTQT